MPRLFLTPLVIAGLLFLPGCSNAEAKACEAAEQAIKDFELVALKTEIKRGYDIEGVKTMQEAIEYRSLSMLVLRAKLDARQVVVNSPTCFTPKEVVEAQNYIETEKQWIE